jgi:hypothetical protein
MTFFQGTQSPEAVAEGAVRSFARRHAMPALEMWSNDWTPELLTKLAAETWNRRAE